MFMIFLLINFDEGLSNLRSSKNNNKESDDLPRSPSVLIERLINLMLENVGVRSDMREWYFAFLIYLFLIYLNIVYIFLMYIININLIYG